jgi:hypothetical protein
MTNLLISPTEAKKELARRELARRHLIRFNQYVYPDYRVSWHIELICQALEMTMAGLIRFLIIEMPPRHSKSLNVSQLFPAFVVGQDPDAPIIVASYSGDLASDHGRETRNLIKSTEYQNLFKTRLAPDSEAKSKWNTIVLDENDKEKPAKGAYNAAGVGGSITGKGAKYFIIDDPIKDRKEADSEVSREDAWKWMRSTARTRLTPDGAMIIMHTRWHDDDMIGRLTNEDSKYKETWIDFLDFIQGRGNGEKWVRLRLPAIAEKDEQHRKEGEALWPTRYPITELEDIKGALGSYEFSALYQQNPIDEADQEFKKEWFRYRTAEEVGQMDTRKFATIDSALSRGADSDFTGVTRNYVNYNNEWNLRSNRYKISSKGLVDLIFLLHREGFEEIGIEEGAYLAAVEPFLKEEMDKRNIFPNVTVLKHGGTMKETRIRGLIPRYENKKVFHIGKECVDLESELARFPKSTHDDCADATAYQNQIAKPPFRDLQRESEIYQNRARGDQFK